MDRTATPTRLYSCEVTRYHFGRLQKLHDLIDTIPEEHWEMNIWWQKNSCGTIGCALGHACNFPPFKRAGLGLKEDPMDGRFIPTYHTKKTQTTYATKVAAMCFFGLSLEAAEWLFYPYRYPQLSVAPQHVQERIRRILASHPHNPANK